MPSTHTRPAVVMALSCLPYDLMPIVPLKPLPCTYTLLYGSSTHVPWPLGVPQLASFLFYAPGFGGRQWFTGPAPNLD